MKSNHLLLWLEAPLQSWGVDSRFGRRDTLQFPTKSGVLGLLCCSLGAGGSQLELLSEMGPLQQSVIAFKKTKDPLMRNSKTRITEPLLRDFHMVGSGYDASNPWQDLMIPKKSNGERAVGGGSKITYRYYVQDSAFAVALEVPLQKIAEFSTALSNPCWDLYLGRKCCVPTDIIFRGCYETEDVAFSRAQEIAEEKNLVEEFRVIEGNKEGESLILNDVPEQFGQLKRYRERVVTIIHSFYEE